ncbi:HU family DNA-binding protein [Prevotellaceae bacterium LCP21S3_C11]
MNKSSLSVLAKAVASKRGLTQAEAERFIATMFEVAGAGIQEDKLLKMKWLGTFKITSVKDRESVDVNTGERILIEGRDKISFTPDNIMKEIINKPFAQFETVVVNDGVDFSDIDEKFANMEREEELLLQKEQERHDDEVVLEEQNAEQPQELDQNVRQSREEEQSQENLPDAELQSQENLPDAELQSQENLPDAELQSQENLSDAELQSQENLPDAELQSQENLPDAELQSQENLSDAELQSQENLPDAELQSQENLPDAELQSQENLPDAELQSQDDGEKNDLSQESLLNEELTQENNQKVEQPQEVKSPISEENVALSSELKNVETSADDFSETYASDRHHLVIPKYVVALVCVVFVALLGGLCWFAFTYGKMQARQEQMEMQLKATQSQSKPVAAVPVDTAKSVASSDEKDLSAKMDVESAQANGAQANNAQADHAQLAMKKKAKQDSIRMAQANNAVKMAEKASEYLNDPRIRTGAYRIVGVEKTVTAKSGQTLAGLSKLYLGPGMECYMQAINGCSEIKTGQKVKIPKLELKRKGKKN